MKGGSIAENVSRKFTVNSHAEIRFAPATSVGAQTVKARHADMSSATYMATARTICLFVSAARKHQLR